MPASPKSPICRTLSDQENVFIFLPSGVMGEVLARNPVIKHRHYENEPGAFAVLIDLFLDEGAEVLPSFKNARQRHNSPGEERCLFQLTSWGRIYQRIARGRGRFGFRIISQYRPGRDGLLVGAREYEAAKEQEARHAG